MYMSLHLIYASPVFVIYVREEINLKYIETKTPPVDASLPFCRVVKIKQLTACKNCHLHVHVLHNLVQYSYDFVFKYS